MNYGQLVGEVQRYAGMERVVPVNRIDGAFFDPDEILAPIIAAQGGSK